MHLYDDLLVECDSLDVEVYEKDDMKSKGLYADNIIWINKMLPSIIEKYCILTEEIGHHHTTTGDILDLTSIENRKQELRARSWAYERLIPFSKIIQAHLLHIVNRYELADFLNVTEDFLDDALDWYKSKYGLYVSIDNFTVCFEPLGVIEMFDWIETPILKYG
ncbi:ImmA/IrrE family metallo-endopeptidase [Lysinibacillus fusiformis]|uniref:ImmA/IrrE family metallo-endopeptidase n=1 Tax=Lysinibacillus fusiformis TaxID=28031 RepID=UPI001F4E74C3|nr:ImmA/IrrE family metallo-endopeptidase [Lysinibacillus fusiformis]MCK1989434.1 ImmA/IrrE family metallo-endopeptidase [Lysinibacillus fusiformis]